MKQVSVLFILLISFSSCHKEKSKNDYQKVYQLSEMSLLMEDMYDELENIRPKIIENQEIGTYPEKFNQIKTAELTKTFERTDEFNHFADLLLQNEISLYQSKADSSRIKTYNQVVNTCISCHKSDAGCIGPVSRIGKLLIKL